MDVKLNEIQHQILAKTSVQMLIERFDCVIHDGGQKTRTDISNRVQSWITKIQISEKKPRVMSVDNPAADPFSDKSPWMINQKAVHGREWCPF